VKKCLLRHTWSNANLLAIYINIGKFTNKFWQTPPPHEKILATRLQRVIGMV